MEKSLIQRINELARKKRETGLTAEEQAEQKKLYSWSDEDKLINN